MNGIIEIKLDGSSSYELRLDYLTSHINDKNYNDYEAYSITLTAFDINGDIVPDIIDYAYIKYQDWKIEGSTMYTKKNNIISFDVYRMISFDESANNIPFIRVFDYDQYSQISYVHLHNKCPLYLVVMTKKFYDGVIKLETK